jgi:hypothetical protein
MALHRLSSQDVFAGTLRSRANETPALFSYVVPSPKPLDANRSIQRAGATGMPVGGLNDNNLIATPASKPGDVIASPRTVRPVVTMRGPSADTPSWTVGTRPSQSRAGFRILWNLALVAVVAFLLVAAFQA